MRATHLAETSGAPDSECIIADVRCLQDPNYAERGVGRVTANLIRHMPRRDGRSLVALADPSMPPLTDGMRTLFDAVRPNAQFLDVRRASCFISCSPMTHDPLFAMRLLQDARPLKVAVVYDFIPYELPDRYLTQPEQRVAYFQNLRALARHDQFGTISEATAAALRTLLGIPEERIVVAGAPLDSVFDVPLRLPVAPAHVMAVGGGDPRKNVECAVRAHATCLGPQKLRLPLVITGTYSASEIAGFRGFAASLGGAPDLLHLTGHVPETELVALYRRAICVIAPSRAEGFDLPIVEAMAAGVPVLASDIAAHRELIADAGCLFDPDDYPRLAALLGSVCDDRGLRARILAAQAEIWPRFRAMAVAERFWNPVMARLDAAKAPAVLRRRKPRLALLTPLPPDRSGVADYSAATCAELGKLTDLHVFTETERAAIPAGAATVRPMSALPYLSGRFERVVSVVGNSHFHLNTFHHLLRYGGACIAHDSRMLGFYGILLGRDRALAVAGQELSRTVTPAELDSWMADEGVLEAVFYGEIAAAADPLVVHSSGTAALLRARFGVAAAHLPFCIYHPPPPELLAGKPAARRRLGLPDNEVVIASFGFVHRSKAPLDCLWALEMLRGWGINASLHFVGAHADDLELTSLAKRIGVSEHVVFLGAYVSDETYRDYLLGADLGLQLRLTYLGSLSGALLDCIAAGLPTVCNASLAEVMEAPDYVARVPDRLSPVLIAGALADLLESGQAHQRPEAERRAYAAAHDFGVYAQRLCAALQLDVAA